MSDAPLEATAAGTIHVNGEPHRPPPEGTVRSLLEELGLAGRRIAVAVNRNVVPRSEYAKAPLRHGDRIEILEAVGGG